MMKEVENVIDELRYTDRQFETGAKIYTVYRRYKAPPTKMCYQCRNDEFRSVHCDTEFRVCKFLNVLRSANAWLMSRQMENSAL